MAKRKERIQNPEPFVPDGTELAKSKKRSKAPKKHQTEGKLIDSNISSKIMKEALIQQKEVEEEEEEGAKGNENTKSSFNRLEELPKVEEVDDDIDQFAGFSEAQSQLGEYEEIDEEDERIMEAFLSKEPGCQKSLADIIVERIKEKDVSVASENRPVPKLDKSIIDIYKGVATHLSKYTVGKIPKAFKHIPSMQLWEEVLYVTEPENWSPNALYQATRIFASNFGAKKAERFYRLVLLPRVREDISRRYANPKIFVAIFSLIATMRSAYFVYMIGVMSTLEKRYAFPSKLSALILIADNISGMVMSPVIGYLGTKFHGPKIIGWGTVLVGLSSIVSGLPYLLYGPATHLLSAETLGYKSSSPSSFNSSTKYDLCSLSGKPETCQDADRHTFVVGAYALLWAGSFVNGLGNTAFWVVGVPYLDDNVEKKNSPVYFSTTMVIRYSGVALGFLLSSFSLSLYENPTISVNIPRNDPRWVGAWWIGFFIIGFGILLSAIPMFMFPVTMRSNKKQEAKKKMSFTDALATFKRIITNPVLVFDTLGGAMRVIGWAGYYITKTRYIEAQFRQSAAASSFLTGSTSSVLKVIGIFAGGLAISKFRPRPKVLIAYVVFIEMVCNVFILAGIFIGCPAPKFGNIIVDQNTAKASLLNGCNRDCSCTTSVFQPVCGSDGKTNYFSPCYAGCQVSLTNESYSGFSQCSCQPEMDDSVTSGYCDQECNTLPLYLTIIGLAGIISSTAWAGNFIIALRAVDPKDKAFAMGLIGSCMAIFAYIPYPIIFGFVTDAACLVWEESCGETGNCWLYDIDKFRVYLHGTAFTLVMIGSCFDIGVLVYANRLKNLYDDEDDVQTGKGNHEMSGANGIKAEEEEALFDPSQTKSNCNHN